MVLFPKLLILLSLFSMSLCVLKTLESTVNTGTIWVTCDNILNSISVAGASVSLSGSTNDYASTKVINTPLKPGDLISVTCNNSGGGVTKDNPAGLIATVRYVKENGVTDYFNTDTRWLCDGAYPDFQGTNLESSWSDYGSIASIDNSANWIWGSSGPAQTVCSTIVPMATNAQIIINIDDFLLDIKVNGKSIWIYGPLTTWNVPKIIDTIINPGDTVSITGQNKNGVFSGLNPAGMIGVIKYINSSGKAAAINTGSGWLCEGAAAWLIGLQKSANWPNLSLPDIPTDAYWIWATSKIQTVTCTVTIPK